MSKMSVARVLPESERCVYSCPHSTSPRRKTPQRETGAGKSPVALDTIVNVSTIMGKCVHSASPLSRSVPMNTAACLLAEPMVLPLEPVPIAEPEEPVEAAPPPADVSLKVPTDRDFEIYEQAVFAGMPQRLVAKKHGISQPRVHQI